MCPAGPRNPNDCWLPSVGVPVKALKASSRASQHSLKSFIVKSPPRDCKILRSSQVQRRSKMWERYSYIFMSLGSAFGGGEG